MERLTAALSDRYRVESEIGRGGMAHVFLAHDLKLDRSVALKVLRPELAAALGGERFLREITLSAQLDHPHILPLLDSGETDGTLFYTMPFVEGESLRERLDREGQLPFEDARQIAREVADALSHAHSRGIIHRDIKPENILLAGGHARVADFGIAKAVNDAGGGQLTGTGVSIGTPAYMSPEQAEATKPVDGRSDLYSLACVLYEMLAGHPPFFGATAHELLARHTMDPVPPLRTGRATVPEPIAAAVEKALAKLPADRFATVQQFAHALDAEGGPAVPPYRRVVGRALPARMRWVLPAGLVVIATVMLALNVGGLRARLAGYTAGGGHVIRLAVLPFENLTGDPEQEYLSDGLTEEMITQLGRLHPRSLSVIGRPSVMRYKSAGVAIDQIGRDLAVEYVLAGSARREAGRIRINAELIRVRGQTQIWTEAYERDLSDVLVLQSDVARQVARALALELLPAEAAQLARARSVDPAAYEAYLKGTQSRLSLTEADLETAERYFNIALDIDPSYAAAWAGIARVWMGRRQMGFAPPREAMRRAKEATLEALAQDATDYEAHRALTGILTWGDWNWPAAERQWNRVLEINSNDGEALAGYSHFLMNMGRPEEAMARVEQALALDPYNVKVRSFYVTDLVYARRYTEAIAEARQILRAAPDTPLAREFLYQALYLEGMLAEALALDRARMGGDPQLMDALERGYAEGGYAGAQLLIANVWSGRYGKPDGPAAYPIALRYLVAGDRDHALEWLERAYRDGDGNMPYLGLPIYDSVRADPRFQELLRRLHLPR